MFYLITFFMIKRGTWGHQSRDQSVLNVLVRFQSTMCLFCHKLASFCCFSQQLILYTVLSLSNYYSIFKAKTNKN